MPAAGPRGTGSLRGDRWFPGRRAGPELPEATVAALRDRLPFPGGELERWPEVARTRSGR